MKIIVFILLILHFSSFSQIEFIEDELIPSSSQPSFSKKSQKSILLASAGSAILPSFGHLYLGDTKTGLYYSSIDAFAWVSLAISLFVQNSQFQNTRSIGSRYGQIDLSHKDDDFLRRLTQFRAYLNENNRNDSYEYFQNLQGISPENFDIPNRSENYWDFGSVTNPQNTQNWRKFINSFQNYEKTKTSTSWIIGSLILIRVFSVIHTIYSYRQNPKSKQNTILSFDEVISLITPNQISLMMKVSF